MADHDDPGPATARPVTSDPAAVRAWVLYDWAESAFVTTVVAAVLPVYFSTVAGATLPSPARATQVFSLTTSAALVVLGLVSPVLGSYMDLAAAKKRLLGLFMALGAVATGALVLVGEGDWLLAAVLFGIGRIGFGFANVAYDALLPAVAAPQDRDRVSAQGYALGYLGGGLLLAVNVAMILALPDDGLGARLSFVTVAAWWALFSLPLLRRVPEPPPLGGGARTAGLRASVRQVRVMVASLRGFPDLRRYLVSYLVYNDGINVVIGAAAIYGAELGFGATELLLAILLVQFLGGPYALLWGRVGTDEVTRRARVLAFLVATIALLPLFGIGGRLVLPAVVTGVAPPAPPTVTADAAAPAPGLYVGEGEALALLSRDDGVFGPGGTATLAPRTDEADGGDLAVLLLEDTARVTAEPVEAAVGPGSLLTVGINAGDLVDGQDVVVTYHAGPDQGLVRAIVDGEPAVDPDGDPALEDASAPVARTGLEATVRVTGPGLHVLALQARSEAGEDTVGAVSAPLRVTSVEVLPPRRASSLPTILGGLVTVTLVAGLLAWTLGPALLGRFAARLDTKRAITTTLVAYLVVALWGVFLDTVVEFWALAWLVAVVQGGSQALSRSLFTTLIPEARSGEFFGLFSILSKAASFVSPLLFVVAVALFDSSRPALLGLAVMFVVGMRLLQGVDVARGRAAVDDDPAGAPATA